MTLEVPSYLFVSSRRPVIQWNRIAPTVKTSQQSIEKLKRNLKRNLKINTKTITFYNSIQYTRVLPHTIQHHLETQQTTTNTKKNTTKNTSQLRKKIQTIISTLSPTQTTHSPLFPCPIIESNGSPNPPVVHTSTTHFSPQLNWPENFFSTTSKNVLF